MQSHTCTVCHTCILGLVTDSSIHHSHGSTQQHAQGAPPYDPGPQYVSDAPPPWARVMFKAVAIVDHVPMSIYDGRTAFALHQTVMHQARSGNPIHLWRSPKKSCRPVCPNNNNNTVITVVLKKRTHPVLEASTGCNNNQQHLFAVVGGMLCKSDKPSIIIIIMNE